MITKLDLNFDIGTRQPAYVIGDHKNVNPGDKIPLYIPKVMSDIQKGDMKEVSIEIVGTKSNIFINSKDCMPTVSRKVKTCNYITGIMENNCSPVNELKHGTKVTCDFYNKSLRTIYFNTNQ